MCWTQLATPAGFGPDLMSATATATARRPAGRPAITGRGGSAGAGGTIVVGAGEPMVEVLAQAADRAARTGARVVVVHAFRDLAQVWLAGTARAAVRPDRERQETEVAAATAALRLRGLDARHEARPGRPAEVLAAVARDCGAELIVIGSRRRSFPRRRLGPVARGLAQGAPCPVVLAAEGAAAPAR